MPDPVSSRDRLLEAAAAVFSERGYEGTSVAMVARRAGLTTGAIYANFRDKAQLLMETIERGSAQAVSDVEAARRAGLSAANRVLLLARRMVADPQPTQRQLIVEMFAAARRDADVAARVQTALGTMEGEFGWLIDRARDDDSVADDLDTAVLARFCMTVWVGHLHLKAAGVADPDPAQWAALIRRLLEAVG